jgi:two-component system, NarL family, response regulator NreC
MALRILLADDHPVIRSTLRQIIEREPGACVVAEAEDGVDAVELALRLSPDIVLMDTSMPSMNGIEATRQLAASGLKFRVIAISLHMDPHLINEAFDAGASGYLLKDMAARELMSAIRDVLAGRRAVSAKILEMFKGQFMQALYSKVLPANSFDPTPMIALNRSWQ